jgi:diguanylate cyclase (GGDEF)-like protein
MKTPRLTVKLFYILGLVLLALITAYSLLYHQLTRAFLAQQIFFRGETLAQPLWQKVNFNLKVGGNERSIYGLSHHCEQIKKDVPDIMEVAVIDANGLILAHNDSGRLWKKTEPVFLEQKVKRLFKETSNALDVYLPICRDQKTPLLVKVSFSKDLLEKQSRKVLLVSLAFLATVFVLLLITVNIVANLLFGKRIAVLLKGFNSLAQGDLKIRLTPKQKSPITFRKSDELDLLIASFDRMAAELEEVNQLRESQEKQLFFMATHDQLTGLPNRRLLEVNLRKAIIRARKGRTSVLLFIDVDNFKFANDTLGHIVGDRILIALTGVLKEQISPKQLLTRFGGDEFALLMEKNTTIEDGKKLAEKICRAVEEFQFNLDEGCFYFGVSIGIVFIDGKDNYNTILAHADKAMYLAKKIGKNRYEVYYPEINEDELFSLTAGWIAKLKEALINDNFVLFFQPIMKINSKKIEFYEALLRLKDENQLISPGEFIPIAEEFGLMSQIDRWVAGKVIATIKKTPDIKIFMNLSATSLADESLLKFIEDRIDESGIDFSRIGFEITETVAIFDLELTGRWVSHLKAKGCRFALDDFGSGFNSFAYLKHLPVDKLKLDGSFIRTLDREPAQRAFVEAMQQLAQALGVETIAEFVENEYVFEALKEIGVNYGQGYYFGKPAPIFKMD